MSMNEIYKSNNPFKQFQDWHLGNSYNYIVSKCPTLSIIPYKYNKLYTQYFKNLPSQINSPIKTFFRLNRIFQNIRPEKRSNYHLKYSRFKLSFFLTLKHQTRK